MSETPTGSPAEGNAAPSVAPPNADATSKPETERDEELDASLDDDVDMVGAEKAEALHAAEASQGGSDDIKVPEAENAVATDPDPRGPTKKDLTLLELLAKMDDYAPIIPDAVTNYYLTKAGLPPPPATSTHLARLLALATQKFVADIANDAYQFSRMRTSNTTSNNPMGSLGAVAGAAGQFAPPGAATGAGGKEGQGAGGAKGKDMLGVQRAGFGGGGQGSSQGRTVLTMEDLGMAVGEYGVNVRRGEFYR